MRNTHSPRQSTRNIPPKMRTFGITFNNSFFVYFSPRSSWISKFPSLFVLSVTTPPYHFGGSGSGSSVAPSLGSIFKAKLVIFTKFSANYWRARSRLYRNQFSQVKKDEGRTDKQPPPFSDCPLSHSYCEMIRKSASLELGAVQKRADLLVLENCCKMIIESLTNAAK